MKKIIFIACLLATLTTSAQDTTQVVRAFPITDYMVDLNDSIKLVQLQLPDRISIPEKKLGVLKGMYRDKRSDTITIGVGRCQLSFVGVNTNKLAGDYYYFAINYKKSGTQPRSGDLIYMMMSFGGENTNKEKTPVYQGLVVRLAAHFIGLQDVYEKRLYDRYTVFYNWTREDEEALLDSLVADIRFTADYFLKNEPSMNVPIKSGPREGKMLFNTMLTCTRQEVIDFLEYMIARPILYAGHEWKWSEVFATWLSEGGPTVVTLRYDAGSLVAAL